MLQAASLLVHLRVTQSIRGKYVMTRKNVRHSEHGIQPVAASIRSKIPVSENKLVPHHGSIVADTMEYD